MNRPTLQVNSPTLQVNSGKGDFWPSKNENRGTNRSHAYNFVTVNVTSLAIAEFYAITCAEDRLSI